MPLTALAIRNAKPTLKPYKLSDSGGLYLEIRPNDSRYWRLKYRVHGKEKRLALGVFPEVTLAEARDGRDAARKLLRRRPPTSEEQSGLESSPGTEVGREEAILGRTDHWIPAGGR